MAVFPHIAPIRTQLVQTTLQPQTLKEEELKTYVYGGLRYP